MSKAAPKRRKEQVELYLREEVQGEMDRNRGELSRSAYVAGLISADTADREERERVTLASQATEDPAGVKRRILGALEACDGNAARAREAFGWNKRDYERAIKALDLMAEIARRWPARRISQVKEGGA